mgnify:CR=1 FL=1
MLFRSQLRASEAVRALHPEIFQHARDVVGVFEAHAGGLRGEARGDLIHARRGLRRVYIQLGHDLRLAEPRGGYYALFAKRDAGKVAIALMHTLRGESRSGKRTGDARRAIESRS